MSEKLTVNFCSNQGAGINKDLELDVGTTVAQVFHVQMGATAQPGSYRIRVNGEAPSASYVMQAGDRLSISPTKVEGA